MGSGTVPKHLARVGGVPMIERLLRQIVAAGIRRVSVIIGPRGDLIERHLCSLRDLPEDLKLDWIRETGPRGNVGSLTEVPRDCEWTLLSFGDLVTDLDFGKLIEVHRGRGCQVTLCSHYESHRVRLGELTTDGDRVTDYLEKPEKRFLICSGICIVETSAADLLDGARPMGISDLVRRALDDGRTVTHWEHGAFWMDVNSPDELEAADRAVNRPVAPGDP